MSGVQFPPSPQSWRGFASQVFLCLSFVYILQSRSNDTFYKGSINDLLRRLSEHNGGNEESTRRYLPWDLVWYTTKPTRSEALVLERKLKNLSVIKTIEFIKKYLIQSFSGGPDVTPAHQSGCWPKRQHSIPSVTTQSPKIERFFFLILNFNLFISFWLLERTSFFIFRPYNF